MGFSGNLASLTQAGAVMSAGSAVASGIGSYYSALGQKRALQFQAQTDERNALHAATAGEDQASQVLQRGGQMMSTQRAGFAANGVDITDGSAAQVIGSTDVMRQIDANSTVNNAMQQAFGYRTDATMKRGAADAISPGLSGITTLLSGASKVASTWAMSQSSNRYSAGVS